MKSKLLKILSESSPKTISGQKISTELGVSRVSIWKQVQNLQNLGYPIQSTPKGYFLQTSADCLYPWEFPELEQDFHYYPTLKSTMEQAKIFARQGCSDYTIIVAEKQEDGRGRLNRAWESQVGGLYFTLVLRPDLPPVMMHQVSFTASVCLIEILKENYNIKANIKWPNDILVKDRKISGILCEMEVEADMVKYLNIGIGININNQPDIKDVKAASIQMLTGKKASRKEFLSQFVKKLKSQLELNDFQAILQQWQLHSATLNKDVEVRTTRETISGKAIGINESGALIVETGTGLKQTVYFGDCFHL